MDTRDPHNGHLARFNNGNRGKIGIVSLNESVSVGQRWHTENPYSREANQTMIQKAEENHAWANGYFEQ